MDYVETLEIVYVNSKVARVIVGNIDVETVLVLIGPL